MIPLIYYHHSLRSKAQPTEGRGDQAYSGRLPADMEASLGAFPDRRQLRH